MLRSVLQKLKLVGEILKTINRYGKVRRYKFSNREDFGWVVNQYKYLIHRNPKLVNILTQLGKNLQMAVNGSDSWQLPNFDTNSTPVQNWLNALAFACGLRDESTGWGPFRIINGNDGDIAYFVILWYDNINNLTEAFVIGSYANAVVTLYEKPGKQHLTSSSDQDNAVIQDILSTGGWTKVVTIGNGGSEIKSLAAEKVLVEAPTLFDENTSSTWDPTAANNLQELVNGLLYRFGVRITSDGLNL